MAIRYSAPVGTEVSTSLGGQEVRFEFDNHGHYSTDDAALIAILDACAEAENHPIGFAPKEKGN